MSKIFINIPNNRFQIDDFICSLEEFSKIEPTFTIPSNTSEIECNSDELLRQCRKDTLGTVFGISEALRSQLLSFSRNTATYVTSLEVLRTPSVPVRTLGDLKSAKIISVKNEAAKRILSEFPEYKQLNTLGAVTIIHNNEVVALKGGVDYSLSNDEKDTIDKAKICKDFIISIREKSDKLEGIINEKIKVKDLEDLNISDNKYWE